MFWRGRHRSLSWPIVANPQYLKDIFTFGCCILLRIYLTGSLWRRQSQQSFNTLTPFNFFFYSLHVSAPTGHPQVRYTISYLKDYFLIQRIRCTYVIWYRNVICCTSVLQLVVIIHVIKLNIKIKTVKSVKFHVTSGVVSYKRDLIYKILKY
jgi:hypothetical protein